MRKQCLACLGVYDNRTADGGDYRHVCPPLRLVKITRAGAPLEVPIAELRETDIVTAIRAGKPIALPLLELAPDDVRVGEFEIERPNKRDENTIAAARGPGRALRADGAGVRDVAP